MWIYEIIKYYNDGKSEKVSSYNTEIEAKEYVEKMNENRSKDSPFYFVQTFILGE